MPEYKGSSDYENLGFLGKGAQGTVFKVKRKTDGELFAMKQVDMTSMNQAQKDEVENEFTMHCSLDHQYIVKVYSFEFDSNIEKNYMFIYMELCEGGDLDSLITKRAIHKDYLSEAEIWAIAAQLLDALDNMHNRAATYKSLFNLLHRDIKPANIFLTKDMEVRLGDFGLAARIARNGSLTSSCGTPGYMAPEVLDNRRYNQAADCWSLGATLFELITFNYLVDDDSDKDTERILEKINAGLDTSLPMRYSAELGDFIKLLVSVKPSTRPNAGMLMKDIGVQWGQTQTKLNESRKCHEASLRRLKEQNKAARARDNEKNSRIEELEAQLLALQTATEEVSAALDLREQDISAREAEVKQSERRQAQVAKYLDDKERKLHEDRAAFEQLRSSVPTHIIERSTIVTDQVFHPLIVQANRNSSSSSISEVSIELARGAVSTRSPQSLRFSAQHDATRAPCMVEFQMSHHFSNANAVRRRAHTGNLRKRYAPISGCRPSELPLPERKLPSEGDLYEVLSSSPKRSNIPISTRMKQVQAGVGSTCGNPESVLQPTDTNVKRQPKVLKNPPAVALPSVASPRYKTRSVARNAKEAGAPRRF